MKFPVILAGLLVLVAGAPLARANNVFNLSRFVNPGEFALGLAPELNMTNGAGVGITLRYTQGLTDLFDLSGFIGTGSGPRQFRAGADLNFEIFPDASHQPGLGIAARTMFIRVPTPNRAPSSNSVSGQLEMSGIPYIHKGFGTSGGKIIDPFFSMPVGFSFLDGQYKALVTATVGALIEADEHVWFNTEFGIAINNSESYFACGVSYFH